MSRHGASFLALLVRLPYPAKKPALGVLVGFILPVALVFLALVPLGLRLGGQGLNVGKRAHELVVACNRVISTQHLLVHGVEYSALMHLDVTGRHRDPPAARHVVVYDGSGPEVGGLGQRKDWPARVAAHKGCHHTDGQQSAIGGTSTSQ